MDDLGVHLCFCFLSLYVCYSLLLNEGKIWVNEIYVRVFDDALALLTLCKLVLLKQKISIYSTFAF